MRLNNGMLIKRMPWHANMTELNHLGAMLKIKPHVFVPKMNQLFSSLRYSDNPLGAILGGKAEETIHSSTWEWEMTAATVRPLVTVERVEPDGNTTPGKFKRTFRIKLDEDWFVPGDIIHPGSSNKKYQVRIQDQPIRHGKGYIYTVRGMWDDDDTFMPSKYLDANQQWAKLYSQYEEAAEQSGSVQFSAPVALESRMSRYRKKYRITGDAANEVLAVKIQDSKGRWHDTWIKYAEVEFWEQWYRELERGRWYSRSTHSVLGANGRPIYSGPGVQELLEDSHIHKYSHLTGHLIEEYLMDIFYSRVKPGSKRFVKAFTGEYGMINMHRAIQSWQEKSGFIKVVDTNFIQKTDSPYHKNALVAGYQFTRMRLANGCELEVVHLPLYDDREINFEIDPVTGRPIESQRITFLDFSGEEDSNIKLVNRANSFKLAYVHGLHSPYGPVNNGVAAHSGDYYEMHVQKQEGIQITDIGRCGELILARA